MIRTPPRPTAWAFPAVAAMGLALALAGPAPVASAGAKWISAEGASGTVSVNRPLPSCRAAARSARRSPPPSSSPAEVVGSLFTVPAALAGRLLSLVGADGPAAAE